MRVKIVKENLYEFERGMDPKRALGLDILYNIYDKMQESDPHMEANIDSALVWATENNNIEYVDYLLKKGADPNTTGKWPLKYAVSEGYLDIAKLLVENGAKIDQTVLDYASYYLGDKREEILDYLFKMR